MTHGGLARGSRGGRSQPRVTAERIDAFLARRNISTVQAAAGRMWRSDWIEGESLLRARGDHQGRWVGQDAGLDLRAVARHRFREASSCLGPVRSVCHDVLLAERDVDAVALELGESRLAILPMIRAGLSVLVQFYEVEPAAEPEELIDG